MLNADERRELRRIDRRAVRRAATAGALSGLARAAAAIWAHRLRTQDLHPNHHALLRVLVERLGPVDFATSAMRAAFSTICRLCGGDGLDFELVRGLSE